MVRVETVKSVYPEWKPIGSWSGRRAAIAWRPLGPLRCDVLL